MLMNVSSRLVDAGLVSPAAFLKKYGVVKVKGFLPKAEALRLLSFVNDCYAEVGKAIDESDPLASNETFVSQFSIWSAIWSPPLTELLKARRPDLLERWEAVTADIHAAQARIFDDRWAMCPDRVFFRRHKTAKTVLRWHIDGDAAGMWNYGLDTINVWMPLQDVGDGGASSLEFMPGSQSYMRKVPLLRHDAAVRDDEWVSEHLPQKKLVPKATLGDALIFSHWTLHRTQTENVSSPVRASCEFRFTPTRESEKEIVLPEYLREATG